MIDRSPIKTKQISRYLISGITAFAVEYGSFSIMLGLFNAPIFVINSLSFAFGLATSFSLNRLWTFTGGIYQKQTTHQAANYVTLALINLLLTNFIVEFLRHFSVDPKPAKLLAMVVTSIWNFLLFKRIIFAHKTPS